MSIYSAVPGDVAWRTSSKCDAGTCVGVARQGEFVVVRNTGDPEGPVSKFTMAEWSAFIAGAKLGEFDDLG
jgi:predicted secreted Zn-dependent protease